MNEHFKQLLKHLLYYLIALIVVSFLVMEYQNYTAIKQQEVQQRIEEQRFKAEEANCLKNALWYEAGNQSLHGVMAVASVIDNRKNHPDYPDTYCGVIKQPKQFSYTLLNKPDVEQVLHKFRPMESTAYQNVEYVADEMIYGKFEPVLDRSVRFYATKYISNYWTKTKKVAARIGDHVFYKDKEKK
jgi:spore germination cell wall hydrolase CwlJ-like protein